MVNIKAVDIADGPAVFLEKGGEIEKAQGLGPEVIGREVVNPRVDQEEISVFSLQRFSSIVTGIKKQTSARPVLRARRGIMGASLPHDDIRADGDESVFYPYACGYVYV